MDSSEKGFLVERNSAGVAEPPGMGTLYVCGFVT